MDQLLAWAEGLAGTGWTYLVVFAFTTIDGFFPPLPSETLIIALASLWASTGHPTLWLLLLAAAGGAFIGDQIAYQIGTMVDVRRVRLFRSPAGQRVLDWAQKALAERGATFIVAARYVPIGRVAVNMSAGALRYRRVRFVAVDALASVLWAVYSAAIGMTAGAVLGRNPLVGVAVGVVGGIVIGVVVDRLLLRFAGRATLGRTPSPAPGQAGADPEAAAD